MKSNDGILKVISAMLIGEPFAAALELALALVVALVAGLLLVVVLLLLPPQAAIAAAQSRPTIAAAMARLPCIRFSPLLEVVARCAAPPGNAVSSDASQTTVCCQWPEKAQNVIFMCFAAV
jgi:hypothetical protein